MPKFNETGQWVIEPLSQFLVITQPTFENLIQAGDSPFAGLSGLQDFVILDDVPYHKPIVDLQPKFNILQRRDASCGLVYKQIGQATGRSIETHEVYGATNVCKHEFYQGALKNFMSKDKETFGAKITPYFQRAVATDVATNTWFGDITRTNLSTYKFSTCSFPGIFTWLTKYTTDGVIPAGQTFTPNATNYRDPAYFQDAYTALYTAYARQNDIMQGVDNAEKVIYCDKAVLDGYRQYMKTIGTTSDVIEVWFNDEIVTLDSFLGIPIIAVPIWEAVLRDLNGGTGYHHAIILTPRKNFLFATDKSYGEGPDNDMALVIWYYQKDLTWYWQNFLKAGTEIVSPAMVTWGIC